MWKGRKITGDYNDKVTGYNWTIGGKKEWNHPALKPVKPIEHLIRVGSDEGDVVLDMFMGSGTTCVAAAMNGRRYIGIELSEEYYSIAKQRLSEILTI